MQLRHICNLQTQYYYVESDYTMDLSKIDFIAPETVLNEGNANYTYEMIEVGGNSFKARAQAVKDFDGDGVFNVWEITEKCVPKEIVKD